VSAGTGLREAFGRAIVGWVDLARRFAWLVTILCIAFSAVCAVYTVRDVGINTDTSDLLSKDLPYRKAYQSYKDAFPVLDDVLVVVVDGPNADIAGDAAAELAAELAARPDRFRSVFHPASEPFFREQGLLFLGLDKLTDLSVRLADAQPLLGTLAGDMSLRGLFDVLTLAMRHGDEGEDTVGRLDPVFRAMADAAEAERTGEPYLVSWRELMNGVPAEAGDRREFISVQPVLDYSKVQPAGDAIRTVRALARDLSYGPGDGVTVRLTGSVAINHEELETVKSGAGMAGLASLVLVSLLIVVGLRSGRLVAGTLVTLVCGLIWTAAFATAAVGTLNLMSVAFAVLFIGLSVDFGIHFCLRYREELAAGLDHAPALRAAAAGVGQALTLSALAAAAGFFAFVPTAYIGLSELGIIAGVGMFIALFTNLTLLPALLSLWPMRRVGALGGQDSLAGFEGFVVRRRRPVLLTALALGLAAAALVPSLRFDFNPMNLRDPETESVATALELMATGERPPYAIAVLRDSPQAAAEEAARLDEVPEVSRTVTALDFVPAHQLDKLDVIDGMALFLYPVLTVPPSAAPPDIDVNRRALAEFRAELEVYVASGEDTSGSAAALAEALAALGDPANLDAARLAELDRRLLATLPARLTQLGESLSAVPFELDDLPPSLLRRYVAENGVSRVEVEPAEDLMDPGALRRFVGAVRAVAPDATGSPVLLLEAGDAVTGAMRQATVTALVAIALLLVLLLRSLRDTLLVLAPLLLAGVLTAATSVLFALPFNYANVIVLPLLLGLGVASGIHLVFRARDEGLGRPLLSTSTPRAVVFSALTTMASFGSLVVSSHNGTASMGELLTVAIGFTLLSTLVVLPALLAAFGHGSAEAANGPPRT
jgi:hopanoid biosynthesis associated RND transporter like protein HpnN